MRRTTATLGSLLFLIVAPGVVAGLIPWIISAWWLGPPLLGAEPLRWLGVALLVLGVVARSEQARKHAMHMAALIATLGFVGALIPLLRTPAGVRSNVALASQLAMVLLTGIFVVLCVRSFISARRARATNRPRV